MTLHPFRVSLADLSAHEEEGRWRTGSSRPVRACSLRRSPAGASRSQQMELRVVCVTTERLATESVTDRWIQLGLAEPSRSHGRPSRFRLEQLPLLVVVQFEPVARSFGRYVKVLGDNSA